MNYNYLGNTGIEVSELCLGTMTFGKEADEDTSRAIMDHAFDLGVNFFDSATNYNLGLTEKIVGRWMGAKRRDIVLTSKLFFPMGGGRNDERSSRRNLIFGVEASLKRLQTDYLDILYLHHWDENTAIEQTLDAMNTLVEQGKVLYCAVSNFAAWQIMKAVSVTEARKLAPIVALQPMYNLVKRQVEVELLPLAEYANLAVIPYNAMAAGLLTGKYLRGEGGRLLEVDMYKQRYADTRYVEIAQRFVEHAEGMKRSPAALAVAWVMSHPAVTSTLIGARDMEQFNDTLHCLDMRLSPKERAAVTALSIDPPHATDREQMDAMLQRKW
jgi:aryl-alcohol dehydrogenase-like predicted oxidoreductase